MGGHLWWPLQAAKISPSDQVQEAALAQDVLWPPPPQDVISLRFISLLAPNLGHLATKAKQVQAMKCTAASEGPRSFQQLIFKVICNKPAGLWQRCCHVFLAQMFFFTNLYIEFSMFSWVFYAVRKWCEKYWANHGKRPWAQRRKMHQARPKPPHASGRQQIGCNGRPN